MKLPWPFRRQCKRCREREAVLACVRQWLETELRNVDYSRATLRSCVEALADGHVKRPSEKEDSE